MLCEEIAANSLTLNKFKNKKMELSNDYLEYLIDQSGMSEEEVVELVMNPTKK